MESCSNSKVVVLNIHLMEFSCLLVGKLVVGRGSGELENGSDSTIKEQVTDQYQDKSTDEFRIKTNNFGHKINFE